ncbi:MAG: hypothetical protein COT43_12230 [Candidatus Marinimicrobia bacterium CG08_land_8_20_14_0_20_45_22]|nr:MAG: hypothetical protein COT43_12230 [Candidatus Marinimicrobia bacterium CG08_land_8_20_14_0_20_45_22]
MRKIILEIIESYEKRINAVSDIIESAHLLVERFREKRIVMLEELQRNLAHSESLRKTDFDRIMSVIQLRHKERETEVKMMLQNFIEAHKRMAEELRTQFDRDNRKRQNTEKERLDEFHLRFEQTKKEQERREIEVKTILGRFQNEQKCFTEMIDDLLKKGQTISTHEVKCVVQNLTHMDYNQYKQPININM